MSFTHNDQIAYTKIALRLLDAEKTNPENVEKILDLGELIKSHSEENNAIIYDVTEYIYEQLRLLRKEDGAYDDTDLRRRLEDMINTA